MVRRNELATDCAEARALQGRSFPRSPSRIFRHVSCSAGANVLASGLAFSRPALTAPPPFRPPSLQDGTYAARRTRMEERVGI
eukprot:4087698-Pyramimonas_sp.AAC.1